MKRDQIFQLLHSDFILAFFVIPYSYEVFQSIQRAFDSAMRSGDAILSVDYTLFHFVITTQSKTTVIQNNPAIIALIAIAFNLVTIAYSIIKSEISKKKNHISK